MLLHALMFDHVKQHKSGVGWLLICERRDWTDWMPFRGFRGTCNHGAGYVKAPGSAGVWWRPASYGEETGMDRAYINVSTTPIDKIAEVKTEQEMWRLISSPWYGGLER